MKFFFDFLPLLAFFGVYYLTKAEHGIYPAVMALIIASFLQTIYSRLTTGRFVKMHLWVLAITVVMGGLTLALRDDTFIKWKASIVIWIMSAIIFIRYWVRKSIVLKELLTLVNDQPITAPDSLWRRLNWMWAWLYLVFGILNLYVAYSFSQEVWVNFKVWGLTALNLLLLIFTIGKLYPYFPDEKQSELPHDHKEG